MFEMFKSKKRKKAEFHAKQEADIALFRAECAAQRLSAGDPGWEMHLRTLETLCTQLNLDPKDI